MCIVGSWHTLKPKWTYYKKQEMDQTRLTYDALIRDYHIPSGSSYMILTTGSTGYLHFISRYLLLPKHVMVCDCRRAEALKQVEEEWRNFDYLILYGASDEFALWAGEMFGEEGPVIELSLYK